MAKDAVIGFITGYKFDKLKPWIKSLEESGFEGDKILVCYDIESNVIDEIGRHGISVIKMPIPQPFNIVVHRFYHLWQILSKSKQKYRYVITTDVADVIFQTNPSKWLDDFSNITGECNIIGSSEGLRYRDEPWGKENMRLSFGPMIQEGMLERGIFNAGVIAGNHDYIRDLALNVFLSCQGSPLYVPGGGGPDQAAYNVIINMEPWWECLTIADHYDGWACQCGTTVDPNKIDSFRPHLLEGEPVWDGEYALTPYGKKYAIVHQYNRVPEWKEVIEKRYE
jgi:hypothetical protein